MTFQTIAPETYKVKSESPLDIENLEPGTYQVKFNPMVGYHVTKAPNFTLPSKVYGDNPELVALIKDRFLNERKGKVTTANLSGAKGSGKTLCAKQISTECREEHGISTFLISNEFAGSSFNEFLTKLQEAVGKPIIVLIDEFEKIYQDQDNINSLLSLLDGTAQLHMAVLMTMNTTLNENRFEFFKNRPGRAYFNIFFESCPDRVIKEYCADHLKYPQKTEEIIKFSYRFNTFTLDLLSTLVSEINLTQNKKTLEEISMYANIKPDLPLSSESYLHMFTDLKTGAQDFIKSRLNYQGISDVLKYKRTAVDTTITKSDKAFSKIKELFASKFKPEDYTYIHGGIGINIRPGLRIHAQFPPCQGYDDNDNPILERNFEIADITSFTVQTHIGIRDEEVADKPEVACIGDVDLEERSITFLLEEVDVELKIYSRQARFKEGKKLIL